MTVEASITLEVDEIQSGAMEHRRLTAARPWRAGLPKHDAIWAETVPFRPMASPVVARTMLVCDRDILPRSLP